MPTTKPGGPGGSGGSAGGQSTGTTNPDPRLIQQVKQENIGPGGPGTGVPGGGGPPKGTGGGGGGSGGGGSSGGGGGPGSGPTGPVVPGLTLQRPSWYKGVWPPNSFAATIRDGWFAFLGDLSGYPYNAGLLSGGVIQMSFVLKTQNTSTIEFTTIPSPIEVTIQVVPATQDGTGQASGTASMRSTPENTVVGSVTLAGAFFAGTRYNLQVTFVLPNGNGSAPDTYNAAFGPVTGAQIAAGLTIAPIALPTRLLSAAATFEVDVKDQTGAPIAGLSVDASIVGFLNSDPTTPFFVGTGSALVTTDANGKAFFNYGAAQAPADATYYLQLNAEKYPRAQVNVPLPDADWSTGGVFPFSIDTSTGQAGGTTPWSGTVALVVEWNGSPLGNTNVSFSLQTSNGAPIGAGSAGTPGGYGGATDGQGNLKFSVDFDLDPSQTYQVAYVQSLQSNPVTINVPGSLFASETTITVTVDLATGLGSVK